MSPIRSAILANYLLLPALLIPAGAADAATSADYRQALAGWAEVLRTHVDDMGRTDFTALSADRSALRNYVELVSVYGPTTRPGDFPDLASQLAYHINTYNALAMSGVIERGIPAGFDNFLKRASFFRFREITVDGKQTNLYHYENRVIRPLGEPRIHFALNCMVRDCPRLPRQPFQAEGLEAQLEMATREFFTDPRKLVIDHDNREIHLSAILDFYTEDFASTGRARDLPAYVNRYLAKPLPDNYRIRFIPYDWTVNHQ